MRLFSNAVSSELMLRSVSLTPVDLFLYVSILKRHKCTRALHCTNNFPKHILLKYIFLHLLDTFFITCRSLYVKRSWKGLCPPCKIDEGFFYMPCKIEKTCKIDEGGLSTLPKAWGYVRLCKNVWRVFCLAVILSYISFKMLRRTF